jgi:uncharacterized protein (TIGR00255 family)
MRSMTGFGAATVEADGLVVGVEVRSVNHRFLQVKVRLPSDLAELEGEVEARVKEHLERGSVNVSVAIERKDAAAHVRVDGELVARYRSELAKLASAVGATGELSLAQWAALPGVFQSSAPSLEVDDSRRPIVRATDAALAALVAMREAEGRALAKDLEKNTGVLEKLVARIAKRAPTVVKRLQTELARRVAELAGRTAIEPAELAREIALLADKADVAEELSRLASHLEQLRASFGAKDGVGRKLDFLVQEVFREVNTIGSKCADAQIAHWVVDAKTAVERLREQVQNVE